VFNPYKIKNKRDQREEKGGASTFFIGGVAIKVRQKKGLTQCYRAQF